ncbi:MAG: hypothetical protein ACKOJF_21845, partial [Planctomycetaceae bacterium]
MNAPRCAARERPDPHHDNANHGDPNLIAHEHGCSESPWLGSCRRSRGEWQSRSRGRSPLARWGGLGWWRGSA